MMTRPFFDPLSSLKAYEKYEDTLRAQQDNKNFYRISERGINLPSSLNVTEENISYVHNIIINLIK